MKFTEPNEGADGDLFTIQEFRKMVRTGELVDCDGFGYPSNGTHHDPNPDERVEACIPVFVPKEVTHVLWFNQ